MQGISGNRGWLRRFGVQKARSYGHRANRNPSRWIAFRTIVHDTCLGKYCHRTQFCFVVRIEIPLVRCPVFKYVNFRNIFAMMYVCIYIYIYVYICMYIYIYIYIYKCILYTYTCRVQNSDIPRAGRVGVAHGGAAGRQGEVGPGRTRRRRVGSARKQQFLQSPRASKTLS